MKLNIINVAYLPILLIISNLAETFRYACRLQPNPLE